MELTDWFRPPLTPQRVGWYEAAVYDAGWIYEWKIWWGGMQWRDNPLGPPLIDQNQTWRGMTAEQTT